MQVVEARPYRGLDEITVECGSPALIIGKSNVDIQYWKFPSQLEGIRVSKAKCLVQGGMNVRAYPVLHRAVEEGVAYGYRRAHKHTDTPDVRVIQEQIVNAVMNEICEYFDFIDNAMES